MKTKQEMNRLDNYFRESVGDHGTPPSPEAWEKVEARISKKNNTNAALKIAAALAFLGLVTIVLWDQSKDNNTMPVAEQKPPVMKSEPGTEPKTIVPSQTPAREPVNSDAASPPRVYRKPVSKKNPELQATDTPAAVVMESVENEGQHVALVEEKPKSKKIVIVYTLPTINKTATQDVAVEEEKKTGLQKVMDVAMEMRASEIPLGELREAKDDLFALEFKKDKTKTKN
jgi:hypothetical protein